MAHFESFVSSGLIEWHVSQETLTQPKRVEIYLESQSTFSLLPPIPLLSLFLLVFILWRPRHEAVNKAKVGQLGKESLEASPPRWRSGFNAKRLVQTRVYTQRKQVPFQATVRIMGQYNH